MQILNRKTIKGPWPTDAVYVGRGTPLGNPFVIGTHGTREEVIELYGRWLDDKVRSRDPAVLTMLYGLAPDTSLICSCAPFPCHSEHIARVFSGLEPRPPLKPSHTYAGIGSRDTPIDVQDRMARAAARLEALGYILRSGGAVGADAAFERGAKSKQIFLPWAGFNGNTSALHCVTGEAQAVAASVHPGWSKLGEPAQLLMGRNSMQVLGQDLRTPSDFVLCWTPDGAECENERGRRTGGTGQAIALASRWRIPVFNMARPDALDRLKRFLAAC